MVYKRLLENAHIMWSDANRIMTARGAPDCADPSHRLHRAAGTYPSTLGYLLMVYSPWQQHDSLSTAHQSSLRLASLPGNVSAHLSFPSLRVL